MATEGKSWRQMKTGGEAVRQRGGETRETEKKKRDWKERETGRERERETDSYVTADFDEALFHQIPVTSFLIRIRDVDRSSPAYRSPQRW